MLNSVVELVWQISWQAAMVAILVFMLRAIFGPFITRRWRHALWLLVLCRLLLPVLPHSRWSFFSAFDYLQFHSKTTDFLPAITSVKSPLNVTIEYVPFALPIRQQLNPFAPIIPVWRQSSFIFLIWLSVASLLIIRLIVINLRFTHRLTSSHVNPRLPVTLRISRQQIRLHRFTILIVTDRIESPAVTGILRPRILLPIGLCETLSDEQLQLVFLHELAHIKCNDIAMDWVWSLLQCLHWFNPILWLISPLRRNDREQARDEMVLRLTGCDQAECYGRTLLQLSQFGRLPLFCAGLVGMTGGKRGLQKRIETIARFDGRRVGPAWIGFALLITAGSCTMTSPTHSTLPATTPLIAMDHPATISPATTQSLAGEKAVTYRYDINDLLFVPPGNGPLENEADKKSDALDSPQQQEAVRSMRINLLVQYIKENVDPESWKDSGGESGNIEFSPPRPMLLIVQTPRAQQKIQQLLDDLRQGYQTQISIETRYIVLSDITENKMPEALRSRLALVRSAGIYRRDEYLNDAEFKQIIQATQHETTTTGLTAPRLTLFNGQHASITVKTEQAYIPYVTEVYTRSGAGIYDPTVAKTITNGVNLNLVACASPDKTTVFIDLHDSILTMRALLPERFAGSLPKTITSSIQRPVTAEFTVNTACAIPDKTTLLLGGSTEINAGDRRFNAASPDRAQVDAKIKEVSEAENHLHKYLLIRPTILFHARADR